MACHLQIDADPDPAFHLKRIRILLHVGANAGSDPTFQFYADPDPQHCSQGHPLQALARSILARKRPLQSESLQAISDDLHTLFSCGLDCHFHGLY